jgi:hypothetical protein
MAKASGAVYPWRAEGREQSMLPALVLLAAIEGVAPATVSLTLTGTSGSTPVSAERRSLSDVARELREGRRGVGSFSAVETTLPQRLSVFSPTYESESDVPPAETAPEDVVPQPPAYAPAYFPWGYGGSLPPRRFRPRASVHVSGSGSPPSGSAPRRPASGAAEPRHTVAGNSRPVR